MDLADPLTISIAPSILAAFKSFILFSAISLTWAIFTEPPTVLPGSLEPFSLPAAFLR
jgi:hypothetical protein